jgi:hypothetical protein
MSVKILSAKQPQSQSKGGAFHEEGTLIAAGSVDFKIPDSVSKVGVQVVPSGGASACVYATEDSEAKIDAGTVDFSIPWDNGVVTSASQATCDGTATAVRITQTGSGSVKYSISAK